MSALQQLKQQLAEVQRLLRAGDVQAAAGTINLALQACAKVDSKADLKEVAQAVALQQECAALAQTVVDGLVKTAQASGTSDRAIRAYSDAGLG